jgi:hypothetical protein
LRKLNEFIDTARLFVEIALAGWEEKVVATAYGAENPSVRGPLFRGRDAITRESDQKRVQAEYVYQP